MADSVPLKQKIKEVSEEVRLQKLQTFGMSHVILPGPARSYPSATAAYEDGTSFDSDIVTTNNTFRPGWRTPDVAVQQNKVITTNLPVAVTAQGIAVSPSVNSAALVPMPDMSTPIRAPNNAQVQVSWQFSGALSTSTASAMVALYRDNMRIGPILYGNSPSNGAKFSLMQTFIDTPPPGLHAYSVYWAVTGGTLIGDGKGRVMHALTLKPQ